VAAKSKRGKPTAMRPSGRSGGPAKPFRRKSCSFCSDKIAEVDYKNVNQLRRYISERGKIRAPRMTGACRRHQRQVAVAIKRAREMALLPYVADAGPPARTRSGDRS
jgi:small subunit ribosomal protein S18